MAYIFGLIVVALLFLALHYFTELSRSQKLIVVAIFAMFISSAIMYNTYAANEQKKVLEIVKKFQQGKTLICDNVEVNATNFDLSIGTYTFVGKENTPHYSEMIRATKCK
ncbi:MAG: hypothetical protein IE887_05455 [Campylobacterales bacterium]|nr:hypothetical protein [Campylobacterales bacterium]